jgi:anti-sigma factor RsiW
MNCLKAEEQFSAYIEDELDYQAVRAFEDHLSTCHACRREFTLFRESLNLLHQLPQIEPSREFDIVLHMRLADAQVESIPFWQRVLRPLYGQTRLALSGIAVLLVMVAGSYFYQKTLTKSQPVEIVAAPESSRRVPLAEERRVEWQGQQLPLAIPSRELQSLVNFPESPTFNLQPRRRSQQPQRLEQNYILQTVNYTEAPTGGGL